MITTLRGRPRDALRWICILVCIAGACWLPVRPAVSQTPPPAGTLEVRSLEALLRDPPRVPASVRVLLAREWSHRLTGDEREELRVMLLSLEGRMRAEGLLVSDPSTFESLRAALEREAKRRLAGIDASLDASSVETFDRWFLDPARIETRGAAQRALLLARQRDAEFARAEETRALATVFVTTLRDVEDPEARMEELFGPFEALIKERAEAARNEADARVVAARAAVDREKARAGASRAPANPSAPTPLLEAKLELRDAGLAYQLALFGAQQVTWAEVIDAGGEDWDALARAAGVDPRFGDRIFEPRFDFIMEADDLDALDGTPSKEELFDPAWTDGWRAKLASIADERAKLARSIEVYAAALVAGDGVEDKGGVSKALRLAAVGLARMKTRGVILDLVVSAQAEDCLDPPAAQALLDDGNVTWAQLAQTLGDGRDRVAPAQLARRLSSFDRTTLGEAIARDAAGNQRLAATTAEQMIALEAEVDRLSGTVEATLADLHAGVQAEREDVEAVLASDSGDDSEPLRVEVARELMHDHERIAERIAELEAEEVHEPYQVLSDEGRGGMLIALSRHERRQGDEDEDEDEGEAQTPEDRKRLEQKRWGDRIETAEGAVKAAEDVTEMLVHLGVVSEGEVETVLKGLDAANAGLTIATGLASGNVFDVISGTTQLVSILFGVEPPPSPEEVRHEQVMTALGTLAEGQELIMKNLVVISEQIDALRKDTSELYRIAMTTQQLLVDEQLTGYRLAGDFLEARRFYAATRPDPITGAPVTHPELGLASYGAFIDHFQKHRDKYVKAKLFLEDQVRERPLEILKLASDLDEAEMLARALGEPKDWARQRILVNQERRAKVLAFVDAIVDPAKRAVVLGSLAHPAEDHAALVKKIEVLATGDPAATAVWSDVYHAPNYVSSLSELYNPMLVAGLSSALAEFQTYRLLDLGAEAERRMPDFEAVSRPGVDPSLTFGATPVSRNQLLRAPLDDARRLLQQSVAQEALVQGDVLAAILGTLLLKDSARFPHEAVITAKAAFRAEPMLQHNALRFATYVHLHHTPAEAEAIVQSVLALVRPDVRETAVRPIMFPAASYSELLLWYPDVVARARSLSGDRTFIPTLSARQSVSSGSAMDRRGSAYRTWGRYITALDLRVTQCFPTAKAQAIWAPDRPEARYGSEAVVIWFADDLLETQTGEPAGYQLRLPAGDDAATAAYLETEIGPALRRAMVDVDAAIYEIEATYPPRGATEVDQQVLRESWLRELYLQSYESERGTTGS